VVGKERPARKADCLENMNASTSHNHKGLQACYRDSFTYLILTRFASVIDVDCYAFVIHSSHVQCNTVCVCMRTSLCVRAHPLSVLAPYLGNEWKEVKISAHF
jgi:hypothetical protein